VNPETGYKMCKFCENCARGAPLWGVYIPHFDQISVKISVLGSYTLTVAPMGVKFGTKEGTSVPNFTLIGACSDQGIGPPKLKNLY